MYETDDEIKRQKADPDLRMIKRADWVFGTSNSLYTWMKKNYSDGELKYLHRYILVGHICGGPMEIWMRNYLYWERRKRVKKLYRHFSNDIWPIVIGQCYEEHDPNIIVTLSKLECADQQIDSAEAFEELLVRNALKIISKKIFEKRNPGISITA